MKKNVWIKSEIYRGWEEMAENVEIKFENDA